VHVYWIKVCSQHKLNWTELQFWTLAFQWECSQRTNWPSTNRPSFAAANQVTTLSCMRPVTGSTCCSSVWWWAVNKPLNDRRIPMRRKRQPLENREYSIMNTPSLKKSMPWSEREIVVAVSTCKTFWFANCNSLFSSPNFCFKCTIISCLFLCFYFLMGLCKWWLNTILWSPVVYLLYRAFACMQISYKMFK